jgi:hypothetical protein
MPENKDEEMGETLDRLLSMSSVTSVSAESIDTGKQAFQKTIYDDWESYVESIRDKNISQKNIDETKEIIDKIKEYIGENCEIRYSPTFIGFRSKITKGRRKIFTIIQIKKKKIELRIFDYYNKLIEKFPEGRFDSEKYFNISVSIENIERFLPFIKEQFDELSRES